MLLLIFISSYAVIIVKMSMVRTLYVDRLCTEHARIASRPSGAVTFAIGALKPGSSVTIHTVINTIKCYNTAGWTYSESQRLTTYIHSLNEIKRKKDLHNMH